MSIFIILYLSNLSIDLYRVFVLLSQCTFINKICRPKISFIFCYTTFYNFCLLFYDLKFQKTNCLNHENKPGQSFVYIQMKFFGCISICPSFLVYKFKFVIENQIFQQRLKNIFGRATTNSQKEIGKKKQKRILSANQRIF